jgi:DNA helicase HerA-like ATPase
LEKVEQVVRLIRSKGVGIYFVTQNPLDLPDTVLGQLGNRVQHALRAFTPRDQKAVKAAADTFRAKPGLDVASTITEMGVGEALVSTLIEGGIPSPVERAKIRPPRSRMGAITPEERAAIMQRSPFRSAYENTLDRESAHEILSLRTAQDTAEAQAKTEAVAAEKAAKTAARTSAKEPDSIWESATKSAVKAASSELGRNVGRQLLRGILGSLSKSMR